MDIYTILASKPHNPHYLNRYITFVQNCQLRNVNYGGYTEKHHICPKADDMFPEYKSFIDYPWNKSTLTPRQHVIAHMILYRAYKSLISPKYALNRMLHANGIKINTRLYEKFKSEFAKTLSEKYKGREGKTKGRVWVNKENTRKLVDKDKLSEYLSNGFETGVNWSDNEILLMKTNQNKIIINNGSFHQYIEAEQELPEGWVYGRLPDTEETRLKKSKSKIGKTGNALKHVTAKDRDGNVLSVMKNDTRLLDGTLVGINRGKIGLFDHLNKKTYCCQHCGKDNLTKGNYERWHNSKCKLLVH